MAKKSLGAGPWVAPLVIGLAVAAIALAYCAQYIWFPYGISLNASTEVVAEIAPVSPVRVNEIMSSNKTAWMDDRGAYSDYIEITNTSNSPVDVTGWTLTDDAKKLLMFTFPQTVLDPGEYLLVYASDELKAVAGYPFHAPFKLSSSGDAVLLYDQNGNIMESINVPALGRNQVYMREYASGAWTISGMYTPGLPNTEESFSALSRVETVDGSTLVLSEIMADNATYAPDEDGEYCDYIEIHNVGSASVNLAGYGLSDDEGRPGKWRFPEVSLPANGYLLVYASGKDLKPTDGGNLHANFKLNAEGETVVLTNPNGAILDRVPFENLKTDRAWSRKGDDTWTATLPPTPGLANNADSVSRIDEQYMAANAVGVYLNEAMASARLAEADSAEPDWLELYNASSANVDLSGYGVSDDPAQPRKWQFPEGTTIRAGGYLRLVMNGEDRFNQEKSAYYSSFRLSLAKGEVLSLARPDGTIIDRLPMTGQYAGVAYGRVSGQSGFFYLETPTPGKANTVKGYAGRAEGVTFDKMGGWQDGEVTIALSAKAGETIRYTTDCSEPSESSPAYDGPLTVSANTVIRARSFGSDLLPSPTNTQSYLFGQKHEFWVVSLVTAPDNLYSEERGIYIKGPNALKEYPYGSINNGANFWMRWERAANVEIFDNEGNTLVSQGVGIALQGQYSRAQSQKAFSVSARKVYSGTNRFYAKLFPNRDYTEFKSFILRASGQDSDKTRMRDSILTTLADNTTVMHQDTRLVIVYLNGEYWGHYNMRERLNKYSIAQWEGWTDVDKIDIIKANTNVMHGSDETFAQMLAWLKKNGCKTEENLAKVASVVDIDNYLDYIAVEMYVANTDTLNVKRYRSVEGDGKWKWILYDLDWAFNIDTNSYRRWLDPSGMGNAKRTDNTLFVQLMKNDGIKKKFLTRFGELLATDFSTETVLGKIDARYEELLPEMEQHMKKWNLKMNNWVSNIKEIRNFAKARPKKILQYIKETSGMTTAEMRVYFADAMAQLGL